MFGQENKYAATVGADNYYLEYEVKIAGFNSIGHGPNSSVVIIMSQADSECFKEIVHTDRSVSHARCSFL